MSSPEERKRAIIANQNKTLDPNQPIQTNNLSEANNQVVATQPTREERIAAHKERVNKLFSTANVKPGSTRQGTTILDKPEVRVVEPQETVQAGSEATQSVNTLPPLDPNPELTPVEEEPETQSPQVMSKTVKQTSTTSSPDMDEAKQRLIQTTADKAEAQKQLINAEADVANKKAEIESRIAESIENQNEEFNQIQEARRIQQENFMQESEELAKSVSDTPIKNFWADRSTQSKILAGISIFAGGAAAAFDGKSNPALDVINKNIERDIQQQRLNVDRKQKASGMYAELFQQARQKGFADSEAHKYAEGVYRKAAGMKINSMLSDINNPAIQAKANAVAASIQDDGARKLAELAAEEKSTTTVSTETAPVPEIVNELPKDVRKTIVESHKGSQGVQRLANEFENLYAGADDGSFSFEGFKNKAKTILNKTGFAFTDIAKMQTLQGEALSDFIKSKSGAAVTDREREFLEKVFPSLFENPKIALTRIRALNNKSQQQHNQLLDTYTSLGYDKVNALRSRPKLATFEDSRAND